MTWPKVHAKTRTNDWVMGGYVIAPLCPPSKSDDTGDSVSQNEDLAPPASCWLSFQISLHSLPKTLTNRFLDPLLRGYEGYGAEAIQMRLLDAKDVAAILQISTQRVYELARQGVLRGVRIGARQIRFEETCLLQWIEDGGRLNAASLEDYKPDRDNATAQYQAALFRQAKPGK